MTNFVVLVLLDTDTYNFLFSFSPSDRHAGASESEKPEAENKFKKVGEAYGVLSDTKKKSMFDNKHDLDNLEGGGGGFGGHEMDPNQIFQVFDCPVLQVPLFCVLFIR